MTATLVTTNLAGGFAHRTLFERLFTVLQAWGHREQPPTVPGLVRRGGGRSCAPLGLHQGAAGHRSAARDGEAPPDSVPVLSATDVLTGEEVVLREGGRIVDRRVD